MNISHIRIGFSALREHRLLFQVVSNPELGGHPLEGRYSYPETAVKEELRHAAHAVREKGIHRAGDNPEHQAQFMRVYDAWKNAVNDGVLDASEIGGLELGVKGLLKDQSHVPFPKILEGGPNANQHAWKRFAELVGWEEITNRFPQDKPIPQTPSPGAPRPGSELARDPEPNKPGWFRVRYTFPNLPNHVLNADGLAGYTEVELPGTHERVLINVMVRGGIQYVEGVLHNRRNVLIVRPLNHDPIEIPFVGAYVDNKLLFQRPATSVLGGSTYGGGQTFPNSVYRPQDILAYSQRDYPGPLSRARDIGQPPTYNDATYDKAKFDYIHSGGSLAMARYEMESSERSMRRQQEVRDMFAADKRAEDDRRGRELLNAVRTAMQPLFNFSYRSFDSKTHPQWATSPGKDAYWAVYRSDESLRNEVRDLYNQPRFMTQSTADRLLLKAATVEGAQKTLLQMQDINFFNAHKEALLSIIRNTDPRRVSSPVTYLASLSNMVIPTVPVTENSIARAARIESERKMAGGVATPPVAPKQVVMEPRPRSAPSAGPSAVPRTTETLQQRAEQLLEEGNLLHKAEQELEEMRKDPRRAAEVAAQEVRLAERRKELQDKIDKLLEDNRGASGT